ncbi:MAG: hypothetical protein KatS3mg115_2174 [Candidatus Poribacteria bacterium]|nr:MAG: hypothetical protein KatS3mg115_2174 [Candidatus Poribacteria bacterium]
MPIYMDRHYEPGLTRDEIIEAHRQDLAIQDRYGVRFLTYWHDDVRGTVFCLIDSPDKESVVRLHTESHGSVPHEIIEVDPALVEAFLGRVTDPRMSDGSGRPDERAIESAFRVIVFTDLKDSTAMTVQLGQSRAMQLLRAHNALVRNAVREHCGREVKHTGDGFMLSFQKASNAIGCSVAIQRAFREFNRRNRSYPLQVRIGMSAGEPVEEHGDLFGSAVQLASRVCAHAEPEQTLAAETVVRECGGLPIEFVPQGEVRFKGFLHPVAVYEVPCR